MNNFITRFVKVCPKSGKFRGFKPLNGLSRILLPLIGFIALLWILFRVISKPSRIDYPCVKTAMPFAWGFIGEIILLSLSALAFMRSKRNLLTSPVFLSAAFVVLGLTGTYVIGGGLSEAPPKLPTAVVNANEPVGEAKGIFPGRVVWVHNPDATNEDANPGLVDHAWFADENNNQAAIDVMLSTGLRSITGAANDAEAWETLFKYYNNNKGKGDVGYQAGEKIFIKINVTSAWNGNFNTFDLSVQKNFYYGISETSPHLVLSVLRQLVNVAGVPQDMIYIGDPMKHIYKHCYDLWNAEFPDVHYLDNYGFTNMGREVIQRSSSEKIFYSDRGKILRTNVWSNNDPGVDVVTGDKLYAIFEEAEYMINLPTLKGHKRAGITMFAKNHFGSHERPDAAHLHNGLIAPTEMPNISRPGFGLYRIQVDLMGHEILGGKNLVYIMDALWSADYEITIPKKFMMAPFNNDWMSSMFFSLDPVAIESVGYDFLRTEFTSDRPDDDGAGTYVQMEGTDDYLAQCASSEFWPDSIIYDPENDGTPIPSLGVHEHWNNSIDMQYSRNLGTGEGIELVATDLAVAVNTLNPSIPSEYTLYQNYPNPFNPSTTIRFGLQKAGSVNLSIYDVRGRLVDVVLDNEYKPAGTYEVQYTAASLASGIYYCKITSGGYSQVTKMVLMK